MTTKKKNWQYRNHRHDCTVMCSSTTLTRCALPRVRIFLNQKKCVAARFCTPFCLPHRKSARRPNLTNDFHWICMKFVTSCLTALRAPRCSPNCKLMIGTFQEETNPTFIHMQTLAGNNRKVFTTHPHWRSKGAAVRWPSWPWPTCNLKRSGATPTYTAKTIWSTLHIAADHVINFALENKPSRCNHFCRATSIKWFSACNSFSSNSSKLVNKSVP